MKKKIAFIGAGNLATHLSKALYQSGFEITMVYSRTLKSAKTLAGQLNCSFTNIEQNIGEADIYFVATKDSVIQEVLSKIKFENQLVVHCSGSTPLSILKDYSKNTGVFYPLQTFSKQRVVEFTNVPVFVEANSKKNAKILIDLANAVSNNVSILDSDKRKYLHISAVFACNFVNHFYYIANDILRTKNIPFEAIKPLILETALKVQDLSPELAQTGPAVRYDENIINNHLDEIKDLNNFAELYKSISKSIFDHHQKK